MRYNVVYTVGDPNPVLVPFTPEEEAAAASAEAALAMPDLSDWQLRRGLVENGYSLEAIEAMIKAIPNQAERELRWTFWDRPTVIKWDNPTTQSFISWLGIPEAYAKDMWLTAATYTL